MKALIKDPKTMAPIWSTVTEISISYLPKLRPHQRPQIHQSKDAYQILKGFWNAGKLELCEQFCVMLLNSCNRVLGVVELSSGGMRGTVVDPKLIFAVALKACACTIIVAHNHPSGALKPSDADLRITKRLLEAGKFLELPMVDHLIVSNVGYFSFADAGLLS